ncbi:MAG TPA: alpha/beta hydrolase, partial [Variovorax sp.]
PNTVEVRSALLLCGPFGHEAIRIHRLFRVLSERVARQGIAVLRFDYYGCGESGGEDGEGEMKGWKLDLLRAHEELARRSGAPRVSWLGARLSAAVALQSARHAQGLQQLVFWDPILDGPAYVEELRAAQLATLELAFYAKNPAWYDPRRRTGAIEEVLGHTVSRELAAQLDALRPDQLSVPAGLPTTVFAAPGDERARQWSAAQNAKGIAVVHETLEHPIEWTSDPLPNQAIVPAQVTGRLAAVIQ